MKPHALSALLIFLCCGMASAIQVNAPLDLSEALAEQSPEQYSAYPASLAIDGDLANFTHTLENCPDPWLSVTLPEAAAFTSVVIHNRTSCCGERLQDITVTVYTDADDAEPVFTSEVLNPEGVLGSPPVLTVELPAGLKARKVKISRLPDSGSAPGVLSIGELKLLNAAEVDLPAGTLLTGAGIVGLTATQSSEYPSASFPASLALDQDLSNFTHTDAAENEPWWEADFGGEVLMESVTLHNRANCCQGRLRDLTVTVLDGNHEEVWSFAGLNANNDLANPMQLPLDILQENGGQPVKGRYLRVTRMGLGGGTDDDSVLALAEVEITGSTPATTVPPALPTLSIVRSGESVTVSWPAAATGFILESSPNMAAPWTAVPGVAANSVTLPVTAPAKLFFRLKQQP